MLGLVLDWVPTFVADLGVKSRLVVDSVPLRKVGDEYVDLETGQAYNPANYAFGGAYTLVTRAGYELTIDAETGDLATVTDPLGNTLTFTGMGIESSFGQTGSQPAEGA